MAAKKPLPDIPSEDVERLYLAAILGTEPKINSPEERAWFEALKRGQEQCPPGATSAIPAD